MAPFSGGRYLDCTFGGGGHSRAILEASSPEGRLIAIDRDRSVTRFAEQLKAEFKERFEFMVMPFSQLNQIEGSFDGILFDLGLSQDQLESKAVGLGRGFSFQENEPLDMRFDPSHGQTAAELLNTASPERLWRLFEQLAQDRRSKSLSHKIVSRRKERPLRTTFDLVELVGTRLPSVLAPIFAALRIVVNDEINQLKIGLSQAKAKLNSRGVLAVISFHSGEDRIVKQFFNSGDFEVLTKKPITPGEEELASNNRSRSAKLRAAKLQNESH